MDKPVTIAIALVLTCGLASPGLAQGTNRYDTGGDYSIRPPPGSNTMRWVATTNAQNPGGDDNLVWSKNGRYLATDRCDSNFMGPNKFINLIGFDKAGNVTNLGARSSANPASNQVVEANVTDFTVNDDRIVFCHLPTNPPPYNRDRLLSCSVTGSVNVTVFLATNAAFIRSPSIIYDPIAGKERLLFISRIANPTSYWNVYTVTYDSGGVPAWTNRLPLTAFTTNQCMASVKWCPELGTNFQPLINRYLITRENPMTNPPPPPGTRSLITFTGVRDILNTVTQPPTNMFDPRFDVRVTNAHGGSQGTWTYDGKFLMCGINTNDPSATNEIGGMYSVPTMGTNRTPIPFPTPPEVEPFNKKWPTISPSGMKAAFTVNNKVALMPLQCEQNAVTNAGTNNIITDGSYTKVEIPGSALPTNTGMSNFTFTVMEPTEVDTNKFPTNFVGNARAFGVSGVSSQFNFSSNVTMSLHYDDSDVPTNMSATNLAIFLYNPQTNGQGQTGTWSLVRSTVDTNSHYVTSSNIQHFSIYALGKQAGPPSVPTNVSVTRGTYPDKVAVTWDVVNNADGFTVYRGTNADTNTAGAIGWPATNSYDDTSAGHGTSYYYWVTATNGDGASDWSASNSGFRGLSAPASLAASDGTYTDKVAVTWSDSTGAAGYMVYRGTNADTNAAGLIAAVVVTNFDDTNAVPGTNYYYWAQATNALAASSLSASNIGFRGLTNPPIAPASLAASQGAYTDKVAVTWSASAGALGYVVYRGTNADTNAYSAIGTAYAATNYDDTNVLHNTTYFYWATATNAFGASGLSPSNTGWRGLSAPAFVTASQGTDADKVAVTWGACEGATDYRVFRAESADTNAATWIGISSVTNFNDTSAVPAQVYYYWTRAFNPLGYGGFSPSNTGWRAFSAPASLAASDGTYTDKVAVTWAASAGASGYIVYRGQGASTNTASPIGTAAATSYNDMNVAPNVTNYYWARATNAAGITGFSPSDTGWRAAPATPPDAPASLAASDGTYTDKVAVAWSASAGALGYVVYRGVSPDANSAGAIGTTAATNFNDTTASLEIVYYYWAAATNAGGASALSPSNTGWRAGQPLPPLPAPANVAASDGTYWDKVQVTWDAVSGATTYHLYRSLTNSPESATQVGFTDIASCDDTGATNWPETPLYYWVRAANSYSTSVFSASAQGSCSANPTVRRPLSADFDGDLKNDLALYQESSGTWSFKLSASGYAAVSATLGGIGYRQIAKDYDGDAKADPGVYDTATGGWAIMLSGSGYLIATLVEFGSDGYVPAVGDYDGDLKADPALYQETDGTWLVKLSGSGYGTAVLTGFGGAGYTSLALDFDGDGKVDPAIVETATGDWTVKLSGSGYSTMSITGFGGPGYLLVPGMYDTDARADAATYETATGDWEVMLSASAYITALLPGFGGEGFAPVVGDFDGDGKADPALYEAATSTWSVKLSGSSYATVTAVQE